MSQCFSESTIEQASLAWLESAGWQVHSGAELAPGGPAAERDDYGQVVLPQRLRDGLARLNPALPADALEDALRKLTRPEGAELIVRNRALHRLLVDGVTVEYRAADGAIRGAQARVIDFDHPAGNDWLAVNQFSVVENKHARRLDVVLFVNGLPLAFVELQNAAAENATIWSAFQELQTCRAEVPVLSAPKALLVHSASWGDAGEVLDQILRTGQNSRQFKEYVTRLLGYGGVEPERVRECTQHRVTALGGGYLQAEQAQVHRFPLPPGLSGQRGWRRLTITLAWLTPINTAHQSWRRADLWFTPPTDPLHIKRQQAEWRAVQRGTVQHEVLEGDQAAAFVDGHNLEIRVSCRPDAGTLEDAVPYALATTLEVAEEIGVDIYAEIRERVAATQVSVTPQA
ncbi:MAG: type I restriction endonuclease subunit R [Fimbriimonadaceae bacterium]|nr:type I restriction endonuclease subunit R [Fimbriimonadaceae bacterium]